MRPSACRLVKKKPRSQDFNHSLCRRRGCNSWYITYLLAIIFLSSGEQSMDPIAPTPSVGINPMIASSTVRTGMEEKNLLLHLMSSNQLYSLKEKVPCSCIALALGTGYSFRCSAIMSTRFFIAAVRKNFGCWIKINLGVGWGWGKKEIYLAAH